MTNPTLERAARAAFNGGHEFAGKGDGWDDLSETTRETYRDTVRAALMAVRADVEWMHRFDGIGTAPATFEAICDAILNGESK